MTNEQNLADKIERLISAFHDALPSGQGEYGDGGEKGRELCQCFYDNADVILTALRAAQPPADVAGLVERFSQYTRVHGVLTEEDRTFFGTVLDALTTQAQRLAELEGENARYREKADAIHRYLSAKPPKLEAVHAVLVELQLDAQARAEQAKPEEARGLTKEQHHILRHSLGLNYGGKEYRNHFVTGEGSMDYPNCLALVKMGLMTRQKGGALTGGDDVFFVTDAGKKIARRSIGQ